MNLANTPAHCGNCGKVCSGPQGGVPSCSDGKCGFQCTPPLVRCGNACIDVRSSPQHCGACNVKCSGGEVCGAGSCASPCTSEQTLCGGACVNTMTDLAHCGGCNRSCILTCLLGICL